MYKLGLRPKGFSFYRQKSNTTSVIPFSSSHHAIIFSHFGKNISLRLSRTKYDDTKYT